MAFVACSKVGQSLTDWLLLATQAQKDALCAALGCTNELLAQVASENSNGILISGDGTAANPLKAIVQIDPDTNNLLSIGTNGLKAALPAYSPADDGKALTIDPTTHTPKWV